jgi:hypothetical protein
MRIVSRILLCLLLVVFFSSAKSVAAPAKTPPPATRGKVLAVDAKAKTVTLEPGPGAPPVQCVFDDQSTIEINDKDSTVAQVKKGLYIRSLRLDSSTPPVVQDLDLTSKGD